MLLRKNGAFVSIFISLLSTNTALHTDNLSISFRYSCRWQKFLQVRKIIALMWYLRKYVLLNKIHILFYIMLINHFARHEQKSEGKKERALDIQAVTPSASTLHSCLNCLPL